jgi:glycerophosphoryl diester phosphodiesterase
LGPGDAPIQPAALVAQLTRDTTWGTAFVKATGQPDIAWAAKKLADGPVVHCNPLGKLTAEIKAIREAHPHFFDKENGSSSRRIRRIAGQLQQKDAKLRESEAPIAAATAERLRAVFDAIDDGDVAALQTVLIEALDDLTPEFEKDPRRAWLCFSALSQFGPLSYASLEEAGEEPDANAHHQTIVAKLRTLRMSMAGKEQVGVVAHRGSGPTNRTMGGLIENDDQRRLNRPAENSPDAFAAALSEASDTEANAGLDGVECDIYLSRDGIPIVTHESSVLEQLSVAAGRHVNAGTKIHHLTGGALTSIKRTRSPGSRFMTLAELIAQVTPVAERFYGVTGRPFRLEVEMKGSNGPHRTGPETSIGQQAKARLKGNYLRTAVTKEISRAKKQTPGLPIDFVLFNGNVDDVTGYAKARQQKSAISDITVGMNLKLNNKPSNLSSLDVEEVRLMLYSLVEEQEEFVALLERFIVTGVFGQEFAPPELGLQRLEPSKELRGRQFGNPNEVRDERQERQSGGKVLDERQLEALTDLVRDGTLDLTHFRLLTDYPKKAAYLKATLQEALNERLAELAEDATDAGEGPPESVVDDAAVDDTGPVAETEAPPTSTGPGTKKTKSQKRNERRRRRKLALASK